LATRSIRALPK